MITAERPRRFSIVTETYPPEINGVALTLGHLVRGLDARGHTVSVIRPRQHAWDAGAHDPATTLVRGIPLPRYAGLQMGLPAGRGLHDGWTRHRPDAVYVATEGPLGYSAVRTARRLGIPAFSGFHTNFHGYMRHYGAAWLQAVALGYLRHFHNQTSGTIVATNELRDRLAALGFDNLHVLGRGVDAELFTPERRSTALRASWGVKPHEAVLLHVGRLAPEKNLTLVVDVYQSLLRHGHAVRCVLVGHGPLRATLERQHPDVIFTGVLTGQALAAHYASADVFVFPSETETFGNVTLEALASGLAVVAFDYAAGRAHITHGESGLLVPCGDRDAFVARAATLVGSPSWLAEIRRHARASIARVAWTQVVERFESILTGSPQHDAALASARRETC